ncbi:MAG: hypothetical protein EOP81_02705 [Variovorax sp.]|nr:MAG: hypothetical protein EOP81_02705 [Variovorax sp.]
MATEPHDGQTPDPLKDAEGGETKTEQGGESAPKLPHERDQSAAHQSADAQDTTPTPEGKQGAEDIERGIVDTDRGPVTDRVYNDKVRR